MKLRTKLVLALVSCTWVVAAVVGVLSYRATAQGLHDEVDSSLEAAMSGVAPALGAPVRVAPIDRLSSVRDIDLQYLGPEGATRSGPDGPSLPVSDTDLEVALSAQAGIVEFRDDAVQGVSSRILTRSLGDSRGALMAARSLEEVERVLASLRLRILVVSAAVAAVSGLVGALLARSITERLTRLTSAAESVASSGDLHADVPRDGDDETGRLGRAFDEMLSSLALSSERQRRLVQDAGHELRTPMTSLRTNLFSLRGVQEMDPATVGKVVADLEAEAEELSRLVEDVLEVAGGFESDHEPEEVDIVALTRAESERVARRWGRSVSIGLTGSDTPTGVVCRRDLMARAVRNLVDNACKFSPVGTPVEVTVSTTAATEAVAAGLSIEVKDRGPGIEQAELELIFDRFHRSDSARSLPGSGLGLSIVAEVAAAHGGRVLARNRRAGGAAVGIWVPLTPDSYRGPDLV